MDIVLAALCGFLMDLALGDPAWMPHPVVGMGKCIAALERGLRRVFRKTPRGELAAGAVLAAVLPLGTLGLAAGALWLCGLAHPALRFALEAVWCWQALAMRGLRDESRNVYRALTGGTLEQARAAVARIVGRDTAALSAGGVTKAAVETVAENFADGVAAPMFYMLLGGAPLALCYKAVNTMDSMVGYKNERYLYFGRAAAKLDDAANYLLARMAALLLAGAAALTGQPCQPQFRPDGGGDGRSAGRAAGRPGQLFRQAVRKAYDRRRAAAGGAGGHPAGKPDAVCRRDAVHGAPGLRARCGVPAAGAVTEGRERMELTHGGDWAGYAAQYGGMPLDFSANVSPLGLPQGVRQAVARALDGADRYPDPLCRALRKKLSGTLGVPPQSILCGNGAADLIFRLALAEKPKRALVTAPTFAEYEQALAVAGCTADRFFLREEEGFAVTEALLERIEPGLDILFLCEPNNPTGRTTPRALLLRILERCAACGTRLVVDECFNEFLDDPAAHTLLGELEGHENLLLLRAFTKWYAMAGVRLGYALCADGALLERMRAAGQPWAVSALAQAAGEAALEETDYSAALRALVAAERPRLSAGLAALGCRVLPGEANYLLFYQSGEQLVQRLRARGVLLRGCANYPGLGPGWYRAAVRTHSENSAFLQALGEVL